MNRAELRKWIDACRSEADLQLPEFQPLAVELAADPSLRVEFDRSLQWDNQMRRAIQEVPIPAGLEARLWQALAPPSEPVFLARPPSGSRRWLAGLTMLAVTAALVLMGFIWWPEPEPSLANDERVIEQVKYWVNQVRDSRWQTDRFPAGDLARPPQLAARPSRWQTLADLPGSLQVVCYEVPSRGGRVLLFVAPTRQATTLRATPPPHPYPAFADWSVGIWKAGVSLYVVAVQGSPAQYRQLIGGRSPMVAQRLPPGTSGSGGKV